MSSTASLDILPTNHALACTSAWSSSEPSLAEIAGNKSPLAPSFNSAPWTLGATALELMGADQGQRILVAHNFIVGTPAHSGLSPMAIIPHPEGDAYLHFLAVPALGQREDALCLPLQPGLEEYYRCTGILAPESRIVEVPLSRSDTAPLGAPATDIIMRSLTAGVLSPVQFSRDTHSLICTFINPALSTTLSEQGIDCPQRHDAGLANNKARFRDAAVRYGYNVSPGMTLTNDADLVEAADSLKNCSRVWMKLDCGSGGDLVLKIDSPTYESLLAGIAKLRASVVEAFHNNDFQVPTLEQYWPENSILPKLARVSVEADAGTYGEVILNGSNMLLIDADGEVEIPRYFQQITGAEGDYRGSESWYPDEEVKERLDQEMRAIARYCKEDLQLSGIVGVDFLLVRDRESQKVFPIIVELNGRPSISSTACMLAEKVGARSWRNVNVWWDRPLHTMQDFQAMATLDGTDFTHGDPNSGLIIPQAMRTLHRRDAAGNLEVVHSSNAAKILVCGRDQKHCDTLLEGLVRNGVRFSN